jgi:integrase
METRRALGRAYTREENVLLHWDDFLHRQYGRARIVTPKMFQGWIETISHVKATDRRNRMRIVRNFLLFHSREHPRTHIPDVMTFPKPVPPQAPRLVSAAEMAKVLATTASLRPSHQNPIRAETIRLALVLLFCCGLRRGELLRMKIKHFDPREKLLRVEATKFYKSRFVPLTDSVAEEVNRYLGVRRRRRIASGPDAFLLWSNNPIAGENCYSAQALADNWRILCSAMDVLDGQGKPPRIHDLRHSFAIEALCRWYQQGIDVQSKLAHLATYMGHVSPVSTHYYLRLSPDLQQAASRRFNQYANQLFDTGGVQ